MRKKLQWLGKRVGEQGWFSCSVPGNIQRDYGIYKNFPDIFYGKNVEAYDCLEDDTWLYRSEFSIEYNTDERVFFVSEGIEYQCEICFNDEIICTHEGMFSKIEVDITDKLKEKNVIEIKILPHPNSKGKRGFGRDEADKSVKPPVGYGWDWHPRLLVSGLWEEAYLETRSAGYIGAYDFSYMLDDSLNEATVSFEIECGEPVEITLFDMDNRVVYSGTEKTFTVKNIRLWWCCGQGEPYLYHYELKTNGCRKTGTIGFKKIELVMNEGAWNKPDCFPMTRSVPPATICLNNRKIFAKGTNFVRPELFPGTTSKETYLPLLTLVKEANMNIVRNWGGSEVYKEDFYNICDEFGIMVWQEFPLACCCYPDDEHYLSVLEQEATAIVKRLKKHPCLIIWCGGNELFNGWSGMTDQSHPLRLLNSICYRIDRKTPFIMTSPLFGMGHGGYTFVDPISGKDVFQVFNDASNTAYTEFGVPSIASYDYLKTFIPEDELKSPKPNTSWEKHHAFKAWQKNSWMHPEMIKKYFGKSSSVEEMAQRSSIMQCEGYHAAFEEARRQWPECSMAINWCFNEPWPTVANNSILNYPTVKKPAYEAVKNSLRDCMPSARIRKFDWTEGEFFSAELYMLNASPNVITDSIRAYILIDGNKIKLLQWEGISVKANSNTKGPSVGIKLPRMKSNMFVLRLESNEEVSEYRMIINASEIVDGDEPKKLNQ